MNEISTNTTTTTELTKRGEEYLTRIKNCLNSVTTMTSELSIYFNEILKEGFKQTDIVNASGLSKSTVSKMISASSLYYTFYLNYFVPCDTNINDIADEITNDKKLMSIAYSKMYIARDIINDKDSMLYKLSYDEALDYLSTMRVVNNAISCEDTNEIDEEVVEKENKTDSVSDSEYVNIKVHKDNVDLLIYLLTDIDTDYSFLTKDLIKQLEKAI